MPAGSPTATALRSLPSESASVAVIVTSGESESLYCTDWLPPAPSELLTTGTAWIAKFAFERSKKMFPTASILTRACVVPTLGSVTGSEPSFGVLAASTSDTCNPRPSTARSSRWPR